MGPFRVRWGSNPFISFPEGWAERIFTQKRSLSHPQTEDRKAAPFQGFGGVLPPASVFIIPPPLLWKEGQESTAKMHHVHRRGCITSQDGAWGILLSPADFPARLSAGGMQQGNSIRSRAGPSIHRKRHRREARNLAPCAPIPPNGPRCSPFSPVLVYNSGKPQTEGGRAMAVFT